jgi:propionate CoA-transferase
MAFRPLMGQLREMDARLFRTETLGLRSRLVDLDLTDRLAFDADRNILFLNFEGLHVRSSKDVDAIREAVTLKVKEIGRRVAVVVNYDSFRLDDDVASEYAEMVRDMENAHYTRVSRYTTSAFMRVKLGRELTRTVRPHIFESKAEAQAFHSKA